MKDYFFNWWNILDWFTLSIFFVVISQRYTWYQGGLQQTTLSVDTFTDLHAVAFLAKMEVNLMSLNSFCIYFKVLKYLVMVPGMDQLFLTLGFCATEIFIFLIMFFIVYVGFAVAFYLAFGAMVTEYRTLQSSLLSLLRIIMGDFDFDALMAANRPYAFILVLGYVVLVFFILMNMFLAIIGDAYAEVKAKQKTADIVLPNLKVKLLALFHLLKRNFAAAKEVRLELESALADDGVVDQAELADILKRHARDIEHLGMSSSFAEMMRNFDTNNDGVLSRHEVNKLVSEIKAGVAKGALTKSVLSEAIGTETAKTSLHDSMCKSTQSGMGSIVEAKKASKRLVRQSSTHLRRMNVGSLGLEEEARIEMVRRMEVLRQEEEALLTTEAVKEAAEAAKNAARQIRRSAFDLYRECAAINITRLWRGHIVRKDRRANVEAFAAKYRDKQRLLKISRHYLRRMGESVHRFEPIGWHKLHFTEDALHGAPKFLVRSATKVQAHWRGVRARNDVFAGYSESYMDPLRREKLARRYFKKAESGEIVFTNFACLPQVKKVLGSVSCPPMKLASIMEKTVEMMERLNTLTTYIVEENREGAATTYLLNMIDAMDDIGGLVLQAAPRNAGCRTR